MLIDPQLILAYRQMSRWKTDRDGVVWSVGGEYRQTVRIVLPPKSTVEEIPDAWQGEALQVKGGVRYRRDGDALVFECEISRPPAFLDRASYDVVREFVQKLVIAGRRPIIVRFPREQ
jgi:hypothetical protein